MNEQYGMKLRKSASRTKTSRCTTTIVNTKSKSKKRGISCKVNKKCFCVPQTTGPIEFPAIWSEFRINNQLCDGVVRCEDGTEFKVHRAILSAVSPYFKALFTNSINRNQPENSLACMNTPSDVFQKLLDFAYTGCCVISKENIEPLIRYADQYEILGVVQLCCKFILDHLQPTNCLGILRFARQFFCRDLDKRGRRYIKYNIQAILRYSKEFDILPLDEIIEILKDDELNVKSEETVFEAIQKWVDYEPEERKQYVLDLLNCIRMGNLSTEFITFNVLQWRPVDENEECKSFVNSVLKLIENSLELDVIAHPLLRPRIPYDILFAIGGWTAGSPTNFIETYDTRADRWLLSRDSDSVPRAYHGICTLKGLIYMIGGFDGNEHFNTVRCFDPISHTWRDCACMYYPRCYVSVVMHSGKIYAMGGYNGRIRMSSAERYDPLTNQWELIQSMQRQRSDASAAALEDKIYIVGGFNGTEVMNSAEVYDTMTNQWSLIPHMISARSGVSLVAFKDALYALGGFNGFTRLTTGERFAPNATTGGWVQIADMFSPRSNFATVILDDYVFVIGGFNDRFVAGSTTINYVECYDAETNEWFDAAPMNLNRSALSACVISGLPNAKDYSLLGRNGAEMGAGATMQIIQRDEL